MPLSGSCHCGAVKLTLTRKPRKLTECTCSICRRYGARWAYGTDASIVIDCDPQAVASYCWGDRMIDFYHCRQCGCLTHYLSTDRAADARVAVNARMFDPAELEGIRIRLFDGADTWRYLD